MIGEAFDSVLSAAQAGAEWAWHRLYAETAPRIKAFLSLRGAAEPDDVVSEVFLAAARGIGSFEGDEAGFRSWLFAIAHARLIDERRMRARRATTPTDVSEFEDLPDQADVETVVLGRISTQRLTDLFAVLAPDQRDVLTLRIVGDLSLAETAGVLGKSVGAVKVLQHRAINRLRELSAHEGVTQ